MESRGASTDALACLEDIRAATGCFVARLHEVEKVSCAGGSFADSRFAVNI